MKLLTILMIGVMAGATAHGQVNFSHQKQNDMDTKTIAQNILDVMERGWNQGSGAQFAQPFADTSEFVDIRGALHQRATRQYLDQGHQGLFAGIYKGSQIRYRLIQAVPVDGNTLLANAMAELENPAGPLAGKSRSTITMVIIKEADGWKVRAFQNTLAAK